MKVRGRRRCTACEARWSYFETGSPACPDCGSLRSVAVHDERVLHTDSPIELDLGPARSLLEERPLGEVAEAAVAAARDYLAGRGFVDGGELLDLDDAVLAAAELRYVGDHVRRTMVVDDATEAHLLDLLAGAEDGDRPAAVPSPLRPARGLATAEAVGAYRRDLSTWLDEHPDTEAEAVLDRLRTHERRVEALDGEVPTEEAEGLVAAARAVGGYLQNGDPAALERAEERLGRMG